MSSATPEARIDLWYGKQQTFGQRGCPQRWVNILGRVTRSESIESLHYALNGGALVPLAFGSDKRRLIAKGDFNIDLDWQDLRTGANTIDIVAVDSSGQSIRESLSLNLASGDCALPYKIDWQMVDHIQDVAQVVDGFWSINGASVSPEEIGYDRLLAIGDLGWRDYEVTVPITIHGINGGCYERPSIHAGVGIVMRWQGHFDRGEDQWAKARPFFGPNHYGAIGWYCVFNDTGPELNFFDPEFKRPVRQARRLSLHLPYVFKVSVQTLSAGQSLFKMKVWEADQPEPAAWDLTSPGTAASMAEGSILLGAHHVAASFGAVSILAL